MLVEGDRLWRGPALTDLPESPAEAARLDGLRMGALEERMDAALAAGRHAEIVPELERLVVEHPYRERLRGQHMLALYRAGRQADALQAYSNARATLDADLGLEPGPSFNGCNWPSCNRIRGSIRRLRKLSPETRPDRARPSASRAAEPRWRAPTFTLPRAVDPHGSR